MNPLYQPQWRNQNAQRRYPFEDTTSLLSNDGRLQLRDSWLIDAAIYSGVGELPFYISEIVVDGNAAQLTLSDRFSRDLGTAEIIRSDARPISIFDPEGVCIGTLVPGEDANHAVFDIGDGSFGFDLGSTSLAASCVMPLSAFGGLFGVEVDGENYTSGSLVFVGEHGIQLTEDQAQEQQPSGPTTVTRMRVHAMGDPQYLTRNCEDRSRRPLRFIREIVFQYGEFSHICVPNSMGNVLLLADSPAVSNSALQVTQKTGAVVLQLTGKRV